MSACSTSRLTVPAASQAKQELAPDAAVVHCTGTNSSSDSRDTSSMTDSRRQRVLRAVRRPVSTGSRQCVNVLKELLPQEVLQEIHGQVSAGVKPLQAVESVTAQRMGPQVAADVTKLLVAVSLASSAGGGVVQATKALLCLLACPLALGGPMRALTSVLLPTPVAGRVLGACLVMHTTREVLAAGSSQQQQENKSGPLPGRSAAASADSGADASKNSNSSSSLKKKRSGGGHWWAFWQRSRKQRAVGADQGSAAEAATGGSLAAAAAAAEQVGSSRGQQGDQEDCVERASGSKPARAAVDSQEELSPARPLTPEPQAALSSNDSSSKHATVAGAGAAAAGAAADADAAEAAALAAVASGAFTGKAGPHAHPLPAVSLLSCDSSIGRQSSTAATAAAAAAASVDASGSDSAAASNGSSSSKESKQHPAPLPFSPTNSLRPAVLDAVPAPPTPAAAGAETAAADAAAAELAQQQPPTVCAVRRSSSGAPDFTGCDQQPLSPTSSGGAPCSPREEIQEQAAEVQRRWSMGAHSDMVPDPESFKLLQQQPYRPPVFTRLSSGRGGCRITAAAAAAAELAARKQQQRQQQQQQEGAEGAVLEEEAGSIRRHHSLDIRTSGEADGGAAGCSSAGALPPLPEARLHAAADAAAGPVVAPGSQQQQQQQQDMLLGEMPVLERGVVRQRSLDWGHRLCKTDSM